MKFLPATSNSTEEKRFRIRHVTWFAYDEPAHSSHNEVRLKPRHGQSQRTIGFRLEVIPAAAVVDYEDAFGNVVHALSIPDPHRELVIIADSLVELRLPPGPDSLPRAAIGDFVGVSQLGAQQYYDFLNESRYVPFSKQLRKIFWMAKPRPREPAVEYTRRVVAWVCDQFAYEPGTTHVHSDVNHILSAGAGVCQDFAHLTIGILRLAGIPARYVSGYLAPRGRSSGDAIGAQASHAWLEVMLAGGDWSGFDPTHGCPVTDHHVRVAVGRDYADVPPLRGVYRSAGTRQTMRVTLDISESREPEPGPFDPGEQ